MSDLTSFIELLIKQTCRRASYEFEMGTKASKQSSEESRSLYSLKFLKSLYDKPRDNIHKLLNVPDNKSNNLRVANGVNHGFNWMNGTEFSKVERKFFLDFLNKVKDMSPPKSQQWIDLQHYLHYVYRNFANANPDPSAEVLSSFFITEIKDLVQSLIKEDESQLYLRILALLREYCIFAQWNYSKSEGEHTITRLFYYYEAMLSAAKNLSSVFSEFEVMIYKNYAVCWIDFNTCIFIRYFFETEYVQNKIVQCLETKDSPGDTPAMFGLLEDLKNLWIREQKRIKKLNEDAELDEVHELFDIEEAIIVDYKKMLSNNFWIERTKEELESIDLIRLDHQIIRLLGDPTFHPAGPILDRNGQCICEECLIAKYKCIIDSSQDQLNEKIIRNVQRLSFCRRCQNLVDLDYFHRHINSHAVSDLDHRNGSANLPDLVDTDSTSDKDSFTSPVSKEPLPKIASEPPVFKTTCEIHNSKPHAEKNDTDGPQIFQEFLMRRKEASIKSEQILNKNVRNFIKIKKDIFNHSNGNFAGKVFDNVFKQTAPSPIVPKKCENPPRENDTKIRVIRKNGHKPYPIAIKPTVPAPPKSPCDHGCKHEEEPKPSVCQSHGATCDHHKESKKCDCTYCEVFGTSVTSHSHKNNELRDRLRIRLHQRREKRTKDTCKPATVANNNNNAAKVKSVVNKVEERVPLPSSPTNIPPAPSVKSSDKSSDSSLTTVSISSVPDDLHGLVNYIEGNTALNKVELAEKKAAKKARQRMKKEEERIKAEEEQKRLAEELKRKEAERKKEIAKKLAEKERAKMQPQISEKEAKKKLKKERQQAERRAEKEGKLQKQTLEEKSQVLEETIPAMVTIKRVAENGTSTPTVTITLKGSTPDQDKLLYTLVNGSDESQSGKENDNQNVQNVSKKKKKKKQQNVPPPAPKVITKELKVTLALDSNKPSSNPDTKKGNKTYGKIMDNKKPGKQKETKKEDRSQEELQIPLLRLPPGITITKVEGPVANRNYHVGNVEDQDGSTINVGKSGVIVVDTEKLIQNKQSDSVQTKAAKIGKKSRKKKNKKQTDSHTSTITQNNNKKMVTLKNPIFQTFQPKPEPPPVDKNTDGCAPAAIFTNENGMVTIRSSRLQQSLSNGAALNPMPMISMPNLLPDMQKPKTNPNGYVPVNNMSEEKNEIMSPFNAQEILSGLPGIEITKVDKKAVKSESDINKSCQTAQVSIIPASNGGDKFSFDKDDWLYDSVFTPREILEDDMDPDELELEAFKRFCQQSIPPKTKEKVAHLNVADIILKKNFV